jgi:hypothetical protein
MERAAAKGPAGGKSKECVRGEIAPKKISHIQFGLLSPNEMEKASEFRVSDFRIMCCLEGAHPR